MVAELGTRTVDLRDFAYQAGFVLTVLGCMWEHVYLLLRRRRVAALLEAVSALPWAPQGEGEGEGEGEGGAAGSARGSAGGAPPGRGVDRLTVGLVASYYAATVLWAALSLLSDRPVLIFDGLYPFEWREAPWRHLALLLSQTGAGLLFDTCAAAFNGLYLKLAVLAGSQLRLLAAALRAVARAEGGDAAAVGRMRACARRHRAILRALNDMESVLSPMLLGHFVIAQLGICCVIFSAISCWQMSELDARLVKMSVIWLFLVTQLFWLCWFGDYLTVEAGHIRQAAYESGWEKSPNSFRNAVYMIVIRANHPFLLTAGAFVPVSLSTMTNVKRTQHLILYLAP